MPERLREFVSRSLSFETDVLEQVVVELTQLLPRTGAPAPHPDGGNDPPERRQQRDMPRLGARRRPSRERRIR